MTSKVLVADDSLTIQKVIGITLANSGYDLVECVNEDDLIRKVESNKYDLILLDFNLSDTKSGYELSKQIHKANPEAGIIIMLGTFDTIDEGQFGTCGITDKIVKPFESSKFIKKCRDVLEGAVPRQTFFEEPKDEVQQDKEFINDDLDLWTVDAPKIQSNDSDIQFDDEINLDNPLDPLKSEIQGWGFQTDSLESKFGKNFPPVIEEVSEDSILNRLQASSQFVESASEDIDEDETDPGYTIPFELKKDLISEIEEDISADAFWAVDEVVPVKANEYSDIVATNLDEVTADLTDTVSKFKQSEARAATQVTSSAEADTIIHMDQDELVEKLKASLRPMIEELVRDFCRQNAEKIAWEIIPDLAENLIRKEIKEISDSVKH
jgi:DNA-binding response OmpR family regulator